MRRKRERVVGETRQKEQYRGVKSGGVNSRCDIENHEYSWHTSHDINE